MEQNELHTAYDILKYFEFCFFLYAIGVFQSNKVKGMHGYRVGSTNMNYFIACNVAIPHLSNIHIRSLRNQKTH